MYTIATQKHLLLNSVRGFCVRVVFLGSPRQIANLKAGEEALVQECPQVHHSVVLK
jgi:hypothetical protein